MSDLFKETNGDMHTEQSDLTAARPLSDILRPASLLDVVGQEQLTGEDGVLNSFIRAQFLPSFLLWGPPGCGKTTLARLIVKAANESQSHIDAGAFYIFEEISAIFSGVADLKKIFQKRKFLKEHPVVSLF